ncbi:MAG: YaiI/YqxD family protein [Pirellulaceae bacterium]|nr:YaiI/YqxD family protein [Pirellulaceae bacterium]
MSTPTNRSPKIWIDADACPVSIREILFRTGQRLGLETILVANQSIRIPKSDLIRLITVRDGADVADKTIADQMQAGDLVITADIPLAARVVEKCGVAIGSRGEVYDAASIQARLASRNVMEHLRSAGMETSGPKPLSQKDVQSFANSLDRTLTRLLKGSASS